MNRQRNFSVDFIRAFAIVLVVLGHTVTGDTAEYEGTTFFNIIWTLQMPLFFLLSGYVHRYAKEVTSAKRFFTVLGKKTLSYLIPFAVWTFVIRGLVFHREEYFNLPNLLFHMDSGYWFLFSLWTIVLFFETASFLSSRMVKSQNSLSYVFLTCVGTGILAGCLLLLGWKVGLTFLAIKQTVYYVPFYLAGFLYAKLENGRFAVFHTDKCRWAVSAVCVLVWIALITRFSFYSMEDNLLSVTLRFVASLCGSVAVCSLLFDVTNGMGERGTAIAKWIGSHTLQIYLLHGLLLSLFPVTPTPVLGSLLGGTAVLVNAAVTLLLTCLFVFLAEKNAVLNRFLFWK